MNHSPDIHSTLSLIKSGEVSADDLMEKSIEIGSSLRCEHAFLSTRFESARSETASGLLAHRSLAGLAISVKDLFDVEGEVTRAGSRLELHRGAADRDCTAVARLRQAGGVILGRTNMSEFAYSGVGINPHFNTPTNAWSTDQPLIPGGSSSGAAVSVATGAVYVGLGSDTGGSIRIPAALNGIVGFKSTARLVPTDGVIPLSTTLDTVGAMTRSVRDAVLVHEILTSRATWKSFAPLSHYKLGIPHTLMLDDLDSTVAAAWERTIRALEQAGAVMEDIKIPEIVDVAELQATGGFSAAESYAWHFNYIKSQPDAYDPRVKTRILRGENISAREYIELHTARSKWIKSLDRIVRQYDAMISPTVPVVAPPISAVAPGADRDNAFFTLNAKLLRNPSVINMYDGCAISIPCHVPGELPAGLMIWSGSMNDDIVLNVAQKIETQLTNIKK